MTLDGVEHSDSGDQGPEINGRTVAQPPQPNGATSVPIVAPDGSLEATLPTHESVAAQQDKARLSIVEQASVQQCQELLYAVQQRISELSSHGDENSVTGKYTGTGSKSGKDTIFDGATRSVSQLTIHASIIVRDWSDFMNKMDSDQIEYAIEVLFGEPDYGARRNSKKAKRRAKLPGSTPQAKPKEGATAQSLGQPACLPNRIRINSVPLLKYLRNLDSSIDETTSLVMHAPFKILVQHEAMIRETVAHLRQQIQELPTLASGSYVRDTGMDLSGASTPNLDQSTPSETMEHMQVLEAFLDKYIRPTLTRLENDLHAKVRFTDLWLLFKPGDDIHMPLKIQGTSINADGVGITPETFQSRYNKLWRVTSVSGGRPNIQDACTRGADTRPNNFMVDAYYIDFHGRFFRPTVHTLEIVPFDGEVPVTSLEFYPARFLEAVPEQRTLDENLEKGRKVYENMAHSFTHFFYSGPVLMVHPCGCKMECGPTIQEHIESEVIVDFKMALRRNPTWMPKREPWKEPTAHPEEIIENSKVIHWVEDKGKRIVQRTEIDQVYDDYAIDRERALAFQNEEAIFAPIPSGWTSNERMVPDKDVKLLPGRVYAFVMRTRTFSPIWLSGLQPIEAQRHGLRDLQLKDNKFKITLQALVKTHFMRGTSQHEYDIVRGKGKGLVFLLHGAPGLGKTFTAESIAAANGQPLLQITCGDLGTDPKTVDAALKEVFHYASYWRCVLLLDECDIFLAQRNKNDVKRNALVSVFLRVLEHYTGILFLTTNRVGALDEAIKSRITWISYYPPLNLDQTKEIWSTNIRRTKESFPNLEVDSKDIRKFAKQLFRETIQASAPKSEIWNGRKIQNAFKVATALAFWDACTDKEREQTELLDSARSSDRHARLTADHFREYAKDAKAFDDYVRQAMGFDHSTRAFQMQERHDGWDEEGKDNDLQASTILSPVSTREPRRQGSTSAIQTLTQAGPVSPVVRPGPFPRQVTMQQHQESHSSSYSRETAAGDPVGVRNRRRLSGLGSNVAAGVRVRDEVGRPVGFEFHEPAYQPYEELGDYYGGGGGHAPVEDSDSSSLSDGED